MVLTYMSVKETAADMVSTNSGKAMVGGAAVALPSSSISFLSTYHQEIGAVCAIISTMVVVAGFAINLIRNRNKDQD